MLIQTEDNAVIQKTKELCQAILDQPEVRSMRRNIDLFLADEKARDQYETLMTRGQALQEKQQSGVTLDNAEIASFESMRESFLKNPVAQGFLDAQEDMHKLQQSVTKYVGKTFELGRVPVESDLESGGCGEGCGCHH